MSSPFFINAAVEDNLKVSQLIELCNQLLEMPEVRVEGEVSEYSVSQNKWVFFKLKDEEAEAVLGCFAVLHNLNTQLEDGMRVVATGKPKIYPKRGDIKFNVSKVSPLGEGSLKRAFALLKVKLEREGLFSLERKRRIPRYVKRVGIVSSVQAAGFSDFCRIAFSRLPGVDYILANTAVQGQEAERQIVLALDYLNSHYPLDAIVLIRGGGSQEDLQVFNSEAVARAITRSKAPVITGIGHERDVSIADLCADIRAATPTHAANLLVPERAEVADYAFRLLLQGHRLVEQRINGVRDANTHRLNRINQNVLNRIEQIRLKVKASIRTIEVLSPYNTLARGFSITTDGQGKLIKSVSNVSAHQQIISKFVDGQIISTVN